ncbi:MAG: TIR domain-containing protein [Chloroflexi bacterium]|nr:TIR domain-containing protein [Chloroflexota bacterium]
MTAPHPLEPGIDAIVADVLAPLLIAEGDRLRLLENAIGRHPVFAQIGFGGSAREFTPRLVAALRAQAPAEDGTPLLWLVLQSVRGRVPPADKARIDALRPTFNLPVVARLDRLFVSYSRKNEPDARRIVNDLCNAGLRVWYDRDKLRAGMNWWQEIEQNIRRADYFVFCLSPDSIASKVARDELKAAREAGKPIIPAMLVSCIDLLNTPEHGDLAWLADLHILDFTRPEQYNLRLREIILSLPGFAPPDEYILEQIDPGKLVNPFRGLEAFNEVDAFFFTGRDDDVARLSARVSDGARTRLLAVVGASGSGKSSLVRAGLLPILRAAHPDWRSVIMVPSSTPREALADVLHELTGKDDLRERLRAGPHALDDLAAEVMAGTRDDAHLIIFIDQFEEVFTQTPPDEQHHFLELLLHAIMQPRGRVFVLFTMRADFFDRLSATPALAALVRDNLDIATDMTLAQLRMAIEQPARRAGVTYEPGLVDVILEDVNAQPGSLPLLQFALQKLFDERADGSRVMTLEAYRAMGGVQGGLARTADGVYDALPDADKDVLRRVMLRLVEVGDSAVTRRRVSAHDLTLTHVAPGQVDEVLARLTDRDARLLVASVPPEEIRAQQPGTVTYEISHEALITGWKLLAGWIETNRADLRLSSDILALAKDWDAGGRSSVDYLLTGGRLAAALDWMLRGDPTDLQREFVEASAARQRQVQQRAARRNRILTVVFAAFAIVALILAAFAVDRQGQAEASAQGLATQILIADANAADAASVALAANGLVERERREELALALAIEANAIPQPPLFSQAALARLGYLGGVMRQVLTVTEGSRDSMSALAYSPDGRFLATGTLFGGLRLWEMTTHTLVADLEGHDSGIEAVAFSPDGRYLISGGGYLADDAGAVRLWDLQGSFASRELVGHRAQIVTVGFMADGAHAFSTDQEGGAIVWSIPDGAQVSARPQQDFALGIQSALHPDNARLIVVQQLSGEVSAWDWRTGAETALEELDSKLGCQAIALHPHGRRLLYSAAVNTPAGLTLHDLETGAILKRYQPIDSDVNAIVFTSDGSRFATADQGTIRLWDTESEALLHTYYPETLLFTSIAFSPDGSQLVMESTRGRIGIWDTDLTSAAVIGDPLLSISDLDPTRGSQFIHDLRYDAAGVTLWVGSSNGLHLFDRQTGEAYQTIPFEDDVFQLELLGGGDVVVGGSEGVVGRYSAGSEQPIWTARPHFGLVYSIAVHPDGTLIASGAQDGSIMLTNASDGALVRRFATVPYGVYGVALTAGETITALGCIDQTTSISGTACGQYGLFNWDLASGDLRYTLPTTPSDLAFAASPDGTLVLVTGEDDELVLYDALSGDLLRRFIGHQSTVYDVAFNDDGTLAVSGGYDKLLFVWDVATGEARRQIETNKVISRVAFAPGGEEVALIDSTVFAGQTDSMVRRYRIDAALSSLLLWVQENRLPYAFSCAERARFGIAPTCDASGFAPSPTPFPSLTPSPTLDVTRMTATPSRTPYPTTTLTPSPTVTPTRTPSPVGAAPQCGSLSGVRWSPDGALLLAREHGAGGDSAIVWDAAAGAERTRYGAARAVWSPDGTRLITTGPQGGQIWETRFGTFSIPLVMPDDVAPDIATSGVTGIGQVAWSPDGDRVVGVLTDGRAMLWDASSGEPIAALDTGGARVTDIAWSDDTQWFATATDGGTAVLWDSSGGRRSTLSHDAPVYGVAFAPDGEWLVTTSGSAAFVWALGAESPAHVLQEADGAIAFDAAFSPDGSQVLVHLLGADPQVWDSASGERLVTLVGHDDWVTAALWSGDGTRIVTSSLDGAVRVWDAATGAEMRALDMRASVWGVAWSPDGETLAAAAENGTIRLWSARTWRERRFLFPPAQASAAVITDAPRTIDTALERLR